MTRLYEEVLTRLEEMAMITSRTLKMHSREGFVVMFNPLVERGEVELSAVEIVRTPEGRGCYDYREGACFGAVAGQMDLEQNK